MGCLLREAREAAGMTQQEVAMGANMDRAYISEVENGKRSLSVDRLLCICESMSVQAADIVAEVEQELKNQRSISSRKSRKSVNSRRKMIDPDDG
jgi:transcriptional regulator with XRE-family HTH domain